MGLGPYRRDTLPQNDTYFPSTILALVKRNFRPPALTSGFGFVPPPSCLSLNGPGLYIKPNFLMIYHSPSSGPGVDKDNLVLVCKCLIRCFHVFTNLDIASFKLYLKSRLYAPSYLSITLSTANLRYIWEMFSPPKPLAILTISGVICLLYSCFNSLRRKLTQKHPGVADVASLGSARPKDSKIQGTAVVCGGR